MDPVSLFAISAVASGAGAGIQAFGQAKAGRSQQAMFNYQAGVADINAKIAAQNADYARATGEVEAGQYGQKARFQAGRILTQQAASGLDVNTGTAVDVRKGQQKVTEQDTRIIRQNAAMKAWGYEVDAVKAKSEGEMKRMAGREAKKAGDIAAIGSILGGISSVSSKWMQASQLGIGLGA